MAENLNAKHPNWNIRLTAAKGSLLRNYANRNFHLIYGPDYPSTLPYQPNATRDIFDIEMVKDIVLPVHLTVCSAPNSDHMPVVFDTASRTSFQNPLCRPDVARIDWAAFQA
jgi:hypothetical protein